MRLVLLTVAYWDYGNHNTGIFFEHQDIHAAIYEIYTKVERALIKAGIPTIIYEDEMYTHPYYPYLAGGNQFSFRGIDLRYGNYLQFNRLGAKNSLLEPKRPKCEITIVEANIITLDEYFDKRRQGEKWKNCKTTILKEEYHDLNENSC